MTKKLHKKIEVCCEKNLENTTELFCTFSHVHALIQEFLIKIGSIKLLKIYKNPTGDNRRNLDNKLIFC